MASVCGQASYPIEHLDEAGESRVGPAKENTGASSPTWQLLLDLSHAR